MSEVFYGHHAQVSTQSHCAVQSIVPLFPGIFMMPNNLHELGLWDLSKKKIVPIEGFRIGGTCMTKLWNGKVLVADQGLLVLVSPFFVNWDTIFKWIFLGSMDDESTMACFSIVEIVYHFISITFDNPHINGGKKEKKKKKRRR